MKKIFSSLLLVLIINGTFSSIAFATPRPNLREQLLFSVVQIIAITEDGDVEGGSGTTISSDGLILTNNHVVSDIKTDTEFSNLSICYTVSQYEPPRCAATAKIIARNKEYDLALIRPDRRINSQGIPTRRSFAQHWKSSGNKFYAVPFRPFGDGQLPEILDPITVWGYPILGGSTITVTRGAVSGFSLVDGSEGTSFLRFIKTDTTINAGNSGGASFDEYLEWTGVPTNAFPGQLGFITPVNAVIGWLENLDAKKIIDLKKVESAQSYYFQFKDLDSSDSLFHIASLLHHINVLRAFDDSTFRPTQRITKKEEQTMLATVEKLGIHVPVELRLEGMTRSAAAAAIFAIIVPSRF